MIVCQDIEYPRFNNKFRNTQSTNTESQRKRKSEDTYN